MTSSAGPQLYVVRAAELPRESDDVIAVWKSALHAGTSRAEKLDRFYLQCPWGRGRLLVLIHRPTQKIVGVAGYGVRRIQLGTTSARAGLVADMSVLAEHRSLGPALLLQRALIASHEMSVDFLYGFPNSKAIQLFRRVGYGAFGEIHRLARIVRHAPYLERRMSAPIARLVGLAADSASMFQRMLSTPDSEGWRIEAIAPNDARIDTLWETGRGSVSCAAPRDCAHLAYRFPSDSTPPFQVFGVVSVDGRLDAWFCCRNEAGVLQVYDYWSSTGGVVSRRVALSLATLAQRLGCSAVSIEVGGARDVVHSWRQSGYSYRESRSVLRIGRVSGPYENVTASFLTAADEDE